MALTREELRLLALAATETREVEIGCDECLHQIGKFAERELAGMEVPDALKLVEAHLSICEECHEEYEALLEALRNR